MTALQPVSMFNTSKNSTNPTKFGKLLGEHKSNQLRDEKLFANYPLLKHFETFKPQQSDNENIFA